MTTHTTRIRAALGGTLAAGLLLATPTTALADAPVRNTIEGTNTVELKDFLGCGVTVLLEEEFELKLLTFFSDDGSLEKETVRVTGTVTFTNVDNGASFTDSYRWNGMLDGTTGIAAERGVFNRGSGSSGLLEIWAGNRTRNLVTGSFESIVGVDTFADGDYSSTCEELAG